MAHTAETAGHEQDENHFIKVFIGVLIALTIFTFVCVFLARSLAPEPDPDADPLLRAETLKRIAPAGSVNTSQEQVEVAVASSTNTTGTAGADTASDDAVDIAGLTPRIKTAVDGACVACHLAGVAGAPKIGDAAAWAERSEKGLEGMAAVVVSGKGAMPARGGSDLSDEELVVAVEYLLAK